MRRGDQLVVETLNVSGIAAVLANKRKLGVKSILSSLRARSKFIILYRAAGAITLLFS